MTRILKNYGYVTSNTSFLKITILKALTHRDVLIGVINLHVNIFLANALFHVYFYTQRKILQSGTRLIFLDFHVAHKDIDLMVI